LLQIQMVSPILRPSGKSVPFPIYSECPYTLSNDPRNKISLRGSYCDQDLDLWLSSEKYATVKRVVFTSKNTILAKEGSFSKQKPLENLQRVHFILLQVSLITSQKKCHFEPSILLIQKGQQTAARWQKAPMCTGAFTAIQGSNLPFSVDVTLRDPTQGRKPLLSYLPAVDSKSDKSGKAEDC